MLSPFIPILFFSLASLASPAAPADEPDREREARLLGRVRQLTFEGRRAGEGYFSPDGRKMVFQSEREPGNPFYQIYELDFDTGDTRRVSPGHGKTTCAFYRPGSGEIVFASTHHDPRSLELQRKELEERAAGRERRYGWDYDPELDLYVASPGGGEARRLTEERGYDAEASYSPDGRWIVFSSNREAYRQELGPEGRRRLGTDPSYYIDLYLMPAEGGAPRRLTETPGYDGGPFFLPGGQGILWRHFDEAGRIADVWTMNLDGAGARQVTEFGSMSWAPYAHPSGEYILFTSNKLGFENFELYLVDLAGRKEPQRVTYTPGFDGLPVPTPDGKRLAWTSTRHGQAKGQIFVADWNHEAALGLLREAPERQRPRAAGEAP